jgi:hypothetical protein
MTDQHPAHPHIHPGRRGWMQAAAAAVVLHATQQAHAAGPAAGATANRNRAGVVDFVNGSAQVVELDSRRTLAQGSVLYAGQTIETVADSEVHVVMDDGGFLAVRPQTRLHIAEVKMLGHADDVLALTLLKGALRSITGWVGKLDASRYRVRASTATIGIRGTDHEVSLIIESDAQAGEEAGVYNWVNEGGTTLQNSAGEVAVEAGHSAWINQTNTQTNIQAESQPQALPGISPRLRRWQTRHEIRVARHAERIRQHIETRMRKRGMLRGNERLEDAIERHAQRRQAKLQAKRQARRLAKDAQTSP